MKRTPRYTYPLRCQLTVGIDEPDWQKVLGCLNAKEFALRKGELLLKEGDRPDRVGILLSGRLVVFRERIDGRRVVYESIVPQQSFGASFAFLDKKEMVVGVKATEDSRVIMCEASKIPCVCGNACPAHQQFIRNSFNVLGQRCFRIRQKIRVLSQRSTRDKLLVFLNLKAKQAGSKEFDIPYNRQELADFLCVERSAMSAEISKLRRDGVIECEKNHFKLKAPSSGNQL